MAPTLGVTVGLSSSSPTGRTVATDTGSRTTLGITIAIGVLIVLFFTVLVCTCLRRNVTARKRAADWKGRYRQVQQTPSGTPVTPVPRTGSLAGAETDAGRPTIGLGLGSLSPSPDGSTSGLLFSQTSHPPGHLSVLNNGDSPQPPPPVPRRSSRRHSSPGVPLLRESLLPPPYTPNVESSSSRGEVHLSSLHSPLLTPSTPESSASTPQIPPRSSHRRPSIGCAH